jgi:hypothetical protein
MFFKSDIQNSNPTSQLLNYKKEEETKKVDALMLVKILRGLHLANAI